MSDVDTLARLVRDELPIWQRHATITAFANHVDATVPQVKRIAAEVGAAPRVPWSRLSPATLRLLLEALASSSLTSNRFAAKHGYPVGSLQQALQTAFGAEYTAIADGKRLKAGTQYRIGADFERRVRDMLRSTGFWVLRSPGSKTKVDLVALRPQVQLLIQCKRGGILPLVEWNGLLDAAELAGAHPVLVETPYPGKVLWWELLGRRERGKSGSRRPLRELFVEVGLMPPSDGVAEIAA